MSSDTSSWALHVPKSERKRYERAPRPERERIVAALEELARDPRATTNVEPLTEERAAFRKRVGDWRIFFDLHDNVRLIEIVAIKRRTSTTYRKH